LIAKLKSAHWQNSANVVVVVHVRMQNWHHVRAKSALNKSILDQSWSEFRRQLQYKTNWTGAILVAVPPHNTSRTCPDCDRVAAENRPTQAHFKCVGCGYENHADVVGATNILARGQRSVEDDVTKQRRVAQAEPPAVSDTGSRRLVPAFLHVLPRNEACPS
jgi:IS605 OrfB family transposase